MKGNSAFPHTHCHGRHTPTGSWSAGSCLLCEGSIYSLRWAESVIKKHERMRGNRRNLVLLSRVAGGGKEGLNVCDGIGIGLRIPHYNHIFENKPAVDWFEIISENYMVDCVRWRHSTGFWRITGLSSMACPSTSVPQNT